MSSLDDTQVRKNLTINARIEEIRDRYGREPTSNELRALKELPLEKANHLSDTSPAGIKIYELLKMSEDNRDVSFLESAGRLLWEQVMRPPLVWETSLPSPYPQVVDLPYGNSQRFTPESDNMNKDSKVSEENHVEIQSALRTSDSAESMFGEAMQSTHTPYPDMLVNPPERWLRLSQPSPPVPLLSQQVSSVCSIFGIPSESCQKEIPTPVPTTHLAHASTLLDDYPAYISPYSSNFDKALTTYEPVEKYSIVAQSVTNFQHVNNFNNEGRIAEKYQPTPPIVPVNTLSSGLHFDPSKRPSTNIQTHQIHAPRLHPYPASSRLPKLHNYPIQPPGSPPSYLPQQRTHQYSPILGPEYILHSQNPENQGSQTHTHSKLHFATGSYFPIEQTPQWNTYNYTAVGHPDTHRGSPTVSNPTKLVSQFESESPKWLQLTASNNNNCFPHPHASSYPVALPTLTRDVELYNAVTGAMKHSDEL